MDFVQSSRSGLASKFDVQKSADDGSGSEHRSQSDPNPVANAMFNEVGKVAIYGGIFVQHNAASSDRWGFELLQKEVAPAAFYNSAQRVDPPKCHPDTRVEIMQTIFDWIIKSGYRDEYLLWLNGAAGAGKSAIMQSIAERCAITAIAIASYFFVRSDSTRNSMAPFVATLAYQLIQAIPHTTDDISLTVQRNPLIFQQCLEDQLRELIIKPLCRLPPHLQRLLVVFIDGLDECNDQAHQSNLLKILGNVSSRKNIPVVFLIASRREPQIEAEFCRNQVAHTLKTVALDDIQASDDIRRYLNAKFEEIKDTHLRRKFLAPNWPSPAIVDKIVEKSSGQFIYASVVIGYISLPDAHPARQLEIINGIRPRNPSENPFAHLDALYQHIFSRVKRLDVVRNVLAFYLIHSDIPIGGLELLFNFDPGELEVLFAGLAALIQCSAETHEPIKILHASLPDFLLDESRSAEHYINLGEYNTKLLCALLERQHPFSDPYSSNQKLKHESEQSGEYWRLVAINNILKQAKASDRLQHACLTFNCMLYDARMARGCLSTISSIVNGLKNLDFEDRAQVHHHVLGVFAAEIAKYWSLDNKDSFSRSVKDTIEAGSPDLLAFIKLIRKEGLY